MLPFKRTFEGDKQQLQHLNGRLAQYLSRTQQLEQENAHLMAEVHQLRRERSGEDGQGKRYKAEMQQLRRTVEQLSLQKCQAEMERERLWRELQTVRALCSQQTEVCRDISGDLRGCGKELQEAQHVNSRLQQRLVQLEEEYQRLEVARGQEKQRLRHQLESRMAPIVARTCRGPPPPVVSVEEVQEYVRGLSEGWEQTFDLYQRKVEEMERSIGEDQARLGDLQRDKMLCASQLDKMRSEAEKQGHVQMSLQEQLVHMQERCRVDFGEYQMIIEELEQERNIMADTISEKMREHQHLLQVKMDLGMEVAAYRALLEGERVGPQDAQRRVNPQQRERIIEIKMPAQPYTPRASTLTARQPTNTRYTPPASNLTRSPMATSGSISPSRVIPISVAERARHQSPASRRDMISFNKARGASSAPSTSTTTTKDKQTAQRSQNVQKTTDEEKIVKIKQVSEVGSPMSPVKSSTAGTKSVRVMSPPMMSFSAKTETESKKYVSDEKREGSVYDEFKDKASTETTIGPREKKILDSVSVEEIIEKVMKPAGLEAKVCSSGDSTVRYHIQKTEQEDGTTKTQLVLESKVEEELDVSEDSTLNELLSQGVKKVTLEDIEDTATGSMIKDILSGLQGGENLQNKSVNVEIIEEPVESHSDDEFEDEQMCRSTFYEPSTYFQIQELENVPHDTQVQRSVDDALKSYTSDEDQSKSVQDISKDTDPSQFFYDQDSNEYFVSTPDENLSELDEGGGITSYGHYGIVDDLSDERYYQDETLPQKRVIVEESDEYKFTSGDRLLAKEGFPECIIEEEVRVSPIVQESVLEFLREDSLEPKDQLKGALDKLQSSVSGPLREELAFLTKVSGENPQNVAIDFKKVRQSSDNGTTTIVAELNVSQSLEDSGLLEAGDDLSEEQIMAALRSSNLGFENVFQGGSGGGYSIRVSKEEDDMYDGGFEGISEEGGSLNQAFSFQMDAHGSTSEAFSRQDPRFEETPVKISHEKRVATVYLESPSED